MFLCFIVCCDYSYCDVVIALATCWASCGLVIVVKQLSDNPIIYIYTHIIVQ